MLRQVFAVAAYLLALAVMTFMSIWVTNLPRQLPPVLARVFPCCIDGPAFMDLGLPGPAAAAAFNCVLMVLFAAQHNTMARRGVKSRMRALVPFPWERSLYVFAAAIALGTVIQLWQPIPAVVWRVPGPYDKVVVALALAGYGIVYGSSSAMDSADLMGLRQAFSGLDEKSYPQSPLVINFYYQHVRHPLYLGYLLFLFCAPTMSAGRLLYALLNLAFVLWSLPLEEGDLAAQMGPPYERYRRAVPALIPSLRPYRQPQAAAATAAAPAASEGSDRRGGAETLVRSGKHRDAP